MSRFKNQTSFSKNRKRRFFCWSCGTFLTEIYIGEKKARTLECKECEAITEFQPPKKVVDNFGRKGYALTESMFTAEVSENEKNSTL